MFRSSGGLHRGRDDLEISRANLHQTETERRTPVALSPCEREPVEQRRDRRFVRGAIIHVAAEWMKPIHVGLIGALVLHGADAGEGLQSLRSPERDRRRVIDNAVARLEAAQWRALAVTDLHEAERAAAPRMIPRRDRDPELAHDATGANTRSRWPSGSSATKVWP